MAQDKHLLLGPLDHYARSCYVPFCFYLPLLDDIEPEALFAALQDGLRRTVRQIPWLNGVLQPQSVETPGWRPGQLEILYKETLDENLSLPQFHFNRLGTDITYEDLEDGGFPLEAFSDEELIWIPLFVPIGGNSKPECLAAQANFLPGGCLLVVCVNHVVCDGTALMDVCKLWAANCDAIQNGPPATVPSSESADRSVIDSIWIREGGAEIIVEDLPVEVWQLMNLLPPHLKLDTRDIEPAIYLQNAGALQAAIFYMTWAKLSELRKKCLTAVDAKSSVGSLLSGNDAMCALIWRGLSKARRKASLESGRATVHDLRTARSQIHMPLDARPNFSHAIPIPYMGNLALMNKCERELDSLTKDETTLGDVARDIRAVAEAATHEAIIGAYAIARGVEDLGVLPHGSGSGLASFDNVITSLIMYPMEDMRFGGTFLANGGRPDALRPLMGQWNTMGRLCIVLPRKVNGGIEFVLNMLPDEMALLLQDAEFSHYATCLT